MTEHATGEIEDDVAPRRRRYALPALCLAMLAAVVAIGVVVGSWTPPEAASPTTTPPPGPAVPTGSPVRAPLELPSFRGRTVAEASAAAEAAGGTPVIFDARWNRPVKPDWSVCTSGEPVRGDDEPTGELYIAAVPAGDPCP